MAKKAAKKATAPKRVHNFKLYSLEEMEECDQVVEKYRKRLCRMTGVDHVSGGYQYKKGICTGKLAIRIEVSSVGQKKLLRRFINEVGIQKFYGESVKFPVDIVVRNFELIQASGDRIVAGESGTLGGTVSKRGSNVYVTAAHVIAPRRPDSDVQVSDGGSVIGSVPAANGGFYQNVADIDCALIVPDDIPASSDVISKNTGGLTIGMEVTMKGSVTPFCSGVIEAVDNSLTPPRQVQDGNGNFISVQNHFYVVRTNGGPFAKGGDSGSFVRLTDGTVIGIVRAADVSLVSIAPPVTVVSKIDVAASMMGFQ